MPIPTTPYHSLDERDPRVYHLFTDCPVGQQIDRGRRALGKADLPRCEFCENIAV
jgi:hypothetical protein